MYKILTDNFLKYDEYKDLTINFNKKKYKFNKMILACTLPYFKKLFDSGMIESESNTIAIELDGIDYVYLFHSSFL